MGNHFRNNRKRKKLPSGSVGCHSGEKKRGKKNRPMWTLNSWRRPRTLHLEGRWGGDGRGRGGTPVARKRGGRKNAASRPSVPWEIKQRMFWGKKRTEGRRKTQISTQLHHIPTGYFMGEDSAHPTGFILAKERERTEVHTLQLFFKTTAKHGEQTTWENGGFSKKKGKFNISLSEEGKIGVVIFVAPAEREVRGNIKRRRRGKGTGKDGKTHIPLL